MASVKISKGLPHPQTPIDSIPKEEWGNLVKSRRMWARTDLPFDCRLLLQIVDEAPRLAEYFGLTPEQFITDKLFLDLGLVERVTAWLKSEKPDGPVGWADALRRAEPAARKGEYARAREVLERGGTKAEAARAANVSDRRLRRVLSQGGTPRSSGPRQRGPQLALSANTDPSLAAVRIRERLGDAFADALKRAL